MIIVKRKKVLMSITLDHKPGDIVEAKYCTCFDDEEYELAYETFLNAREKFIYDDVEIEFFNFKMNVEEFLNDDL